MPETITSQFRAVCEPDALAPLSVSIIPVAGRKTAAAQIKDASIEVRVPKHWPKPYQQDIAQQLSQRLQREFIRDSRLLAQFDGPTVTYTLVADLEAWIRELNAQTFHVPLKGVRIGQSKHSRLAQINLRTGMMTISKYCLTNVPEPALRYLVLHELAHVLVPNHSSTFWAHVRRFVPDLKYQRNLMQATHRIRIYEASMASQKTNAKPSYTQIVKETPALNQPVSLFTKVRQLMLQWN